MGRTEYWVSNESDILNPKDRPFYSLDRAKAFAAAEAEKCSWEVCLTPPAPDNELHIGRGNFRCGSLAAHGIHIRESVDGRWGEEHDVPEEKFRDAKSAGKRVDWTLEVVIDRGTDYAADGHDTHYFVGPEQTDTGWDDVLDRIANGDEILEATVRPTPFGRYAGDTGNSYPMIWRKGYGF